ncbi:HAD family hydrolase [Dyadobacter sp. NIV53]|uniref:HAD family hydrolase n=1 Tax=Dyadobacter sp. NIV53 TaxID=2861765 RepID=UPI001C8884CB|nr:HAD family hydrolase [Dyadobacter sp. NIV53]
MIKGLLVDYGGTIDTNGLHWGSVLWESYQKHQVNIDKAAFSKAYSFGERSLAINPIIKPDHTFYDTLYLKIEQQFKFLKENGYEVGDALVASLTKSIANDCNDFAQRTIENAKPILAQLAEKYPIVLVSNFYGNIHKVLEVFGIDHFFKQVIESAVVGIRKPNPEIYKLGADFLGLLPEECVVIGDSFVKDIVPAKELGCKAIWLNVQGWEESAVINNPAHQADIEITDFNQIVEGIKNMNQ